MANPIIARKDSSFIAVSKVPDVCKTPMGPNMVPVPYPIIGQLSQSVEIVPRVRANGKPLFVLDGSEVPTVTGDEPGVGGGVKSGTNKGAVRAIASSDSVRADGKYLVRHGDNCEMNNA